MIVVAGVDGGGTRTRALLLDGQGRELGAGEGPPGIAGSADPAAVVDAVQIAVRTALEHVRHGGGAVGDVAVPLTSLWCGLAGAGRPGDREPVRELLEARGIAARAHVDTDVEAALLDAFGPDGPGVVLVAGTGSIAVGRTADGERVRAGGWGDRLGDEGSGWAIGLEGLRSVLRARDGRGPPTRLEEVLLDRTGVNAPGELVRWTRTAGKGGVAALAPEILRVSAEGDPVAGSIVDAAVEELVTQAEAAARRLEGGDAPVRVALHGGLVAPSRPLRSRVSSGLEERGLRPLPGLVRPERGAARAALALV